MPTFNEPTGPGSPPSPTEPARTAAPPPRRRSALRWLGWAVAALLLAIALAGAGLWWWAGQATSLATVLQRTAQWLPAGQSLQSRDVTGSLRSGGRIGWLRWSSPSLVVDVTDAQVGWQLPLLLQRRLELRDIRAARIQITPLEHDQPATPPQPLQELVLPLAVELGFQVDQLHWGDNPALQAQGLAGTYRFDGQDHRLTISNLALAQGRYTASAVLQARAPMALQATVDGTITTPLPGRTEAFTAAAQVRADGTLATQAAQLNLEANLQPAGATPAPGTAPAAKAAPAARVPAPAPAAMRATAQATVRPWAPQPLEQARATLQAVNLAALWPQAPTTDLHGTLTAGPDAGTDTSSTTQAPAQAGAWNLTADLTNRAPGPWDTQRLPLAGLQAQARYAAGGWTVNQATATVGLAPREGSLDLQGSFAPATGAVQGSIRLRNLSPAALHSALAASPLSGSVQAQMPSQASPLTSTVVRLTADIRSAAPTGTAPASATDLRIDAFTAQGQWNPEDNGGTVHIERLALDALRARLQATDLRISRGAPPRATPAAGDATAGSAIAGQGLVQLTLPGSQLRVQGNIAPRTGQGEGRWSLTDAEQTLRWLGRLPWLGKELQGTLRTASAKGQAQLQLQWKGGWGTLQQQLHTAAQGQPPNADAKAPPFQLQTSLTSPQLDLVLPPQASGTADATNVATLLQLRALKAELNGQLTQATLRLEGEARTGTQRLSLQTQATGGLSGAGQWQAQWSQLRAQWQDTRRPGVWTAQLTQPWAMSLRTGASPATAVAPSARASSTASASPTSKPQGLTLQASAGQAQITGPVPGTVALRWQPVRLTTVAGGGLPRLQTQGTLQGLPLAWVDAFGMDAAPTAAPSTAVPGAASTSPTAPTLAPQPLLARLGLATDLLLEGQWNVDTTESLRATASLRRTQGDLRILSAEPPAETTSVSTGQGLGPGSVTTITPASTAATSRGTPAGVRQAELSVQLDADTLNARLQWASARAGEIDATASTRLQWGENAAPWPADAPLAGSVRARLPDVGVWSALAPPGWRVRGTLDANATLSGTRNAPRWTGTLAADELAVRSLIDGVDLQGGRLRASLRGNQLELTEFQLQGGRGSKARIPGQSGNRTQAPTDRGSLSATGRLTWSDADTTGGTPPRIAMDLQAQAQALQVLVRADRQVSVSGNLRAQLQEGQFSLTGKLTTDRATIILPDETAPTLDSDVVIRSAARDREAQARAQAAAQAHQKAEQAPQLVPAKPAVIAITLNLGNDFALQGRGITTRLTGEVDVRSAATAGAPPRVTGEVRTEEGRYRAWGQVLDVETGLIRFNGPYNNPSLDILALRPNISVRAGVQVSGSALAPRVRLYSDPELPDAEKLAWVVLGRDATAGGAEAAVLQQAALVLLGRRGQSPTGNLASRVGLDEIGFKGAAPGEDANTAALTFGKRISKDLYLTYERTLSGTLGALYIFYDLSRNLTLRGQAGSNSAVDLIYTMKYD